MPLTILSVAFPFAPVGTNAVGGAEQVLAQLDDALVRAGHRSLVVACDGSKVAGTLIPIPTSRGLIDDDARTAAHAQVRDAIRRTLDREPVDLIHLHGLDFTAYLPPPGTPALATLHLPLDWYPPDALAPDRPATWLVGVSASQMAHAPAGAKLFPPIPNGVDRTYFQMRHAKHRYAVALGRICPEKGFHIALDAARRAGLSLILAGQVFPYPEHQRYFEQEIVPRLDGPRRFLGPVGLARKRHLLGAAQCLVAPSLVPETSSLVAMEALACGTPVVAFPSGALTGIVENGRTGFLVADVQEMAAAIEATRTLDPEVCRTVARERFSLERTVERYFALYEELRRPRPGGAASPSDWADLWHRCSTATPFQSPAWLMSWWRHFGQGTLRLIHQPGGLLPFFQVEDRVQPLGLGITDYLDALTTGTLDLGPLADGVSVIDLPDLPADAALLRAAAPPGWSDEVAPHDIAPVLTLPAPPSPRRDQNRRYYHNRAAKLGPLAFERARPEALDDLFRLHAARWASRGMPGVLSDERVRAFHRDTARDLDTMGLLRLYRLRLNEEAVAVLYGLSGHGRFHYYLGGFDPALGHLGLGTLIVGHAIDEATREGCAEFHFLRGREPYKYRWGALDRPTFRRLLRKPP